MRVCRIVVLLALSIGVTSCRQTARPSSSPGAARRFLSRFVATDGRVIRQDRGGDTVSEGQAYAMLIAEVAQQPWLVRTIWSWTADHLGRPDGLFARHANGSGHVEDDQSATDADVLIAYALLRYAGADESALHRAGQRVAKAAFANESPTPPGGAPLLAA